MDSSSNYKGVLSFEDLLIWQEARQLRNDIYNLTRQFPVEEKYKLVDQVVRSSRSISANIAEGFGRYHYQEFIQFCRHSRGSLHETKEHLICALDCAYISKESFDLFSAKIDSLNKKINGFVKHLKTKKQSA